MPKGMQESAHHSGGGRAGSMMRTHPYIDSETIMSDIGHAPLSETFLLSSRHISLGDSISSHTVLISLRYSPIAYFINNDLMISYADWTGVTPAWRDARSDCGKAEAVVGENASSLLQWRGHREKA